MNGYGGGKGREGEREKGSCDEGERADRYGLMVERSRRRGVVGLWCSASALGWAGIDGTGCQKLCVCV